MNNDDVRRAARFARDRLAREGDAFPAEQIREILDGVVSSELLERWLRRASTLDLASEGRGAPEEIVADRPSAERRERGMYMTPPGVARGLAAAASLSPESICLDLAAGTGRLLEAVLQRQPRAHVVAVERDPALAVVTAVRLVDCADPGRVEVHCGDGLAAEQPWVDHVGEVDLAVLNPPYVREKGRRERFEALRAEHSHLSEWFGARLDLAYLFVHRALDYLAEGGRLSLLSAAYWLTASGARSLRRDLDERARPVALLRAPAERLFADAPGHHSLVSVFERDTSAGEASEPPVACTMSVPVSDWASTVGVLVDGEGRREELASRADVVRPDESLFREGGWAPFASRRDRRWAERLRSHGTRLEHLVDDRQGFVSGADRVTRRRLDGIEGDVGGLEPGDPGFLMDPDEIPDELQRLEGTVVRPVLRGSELRPNAIRVDPPEGCRVLFVDGELEEHQEWVVEHLQPLEPALADRREVRRGRMPWYRLHWPRDRAEQTGPKLVVPRRAQRPTFTLDLSASAVSSDCTYLVAPEEVRRPIRYLARLMLLLNRPASERYLRNFGKHKGEVLEFYSEPLQSLPLPVEPEEGGLTWVPELVGDEERRALDRRLDRGIQRLRDGSVPEERGAFLLDGG